jgi:thioredoxin
VVDLWAPWCGPCRMVRPFLEKLAQEYSERVALWALNADENPDLLQKLKVYSIPTVIGYNAGREEVRHAGVKPWNELKSLFETLSTGNIPTPSQLSNWDRFARLLAGSLVVWIAWVSHLNWFLLGLGGVILFSAVYDRCPIWKAIASQFNKTVLK